MHTATAAVTVGHILYMLRLSTVVGWSPRVVLDVCLVGFSVASGTLFQCDFHNSNGFNLDPSTIVPVKLLCRKSRRAEIIGEYEESVTWSSAPRNLVGVFIFVWGVKLYVAYPNWAPKAHLI